MERVGVDAESYDNAGTFLNTKVKKYPRAQPKVKKVYAILNSIVDFADFSRWSDGKVMFGF